MKLQGIKILSHNRVQLQLPECIVRDYQPEADPLPSGKEIVHLFFLTDIAFRYYENKVQGIRLWLPDCRSQGSDYGLQKQGDPNNLSKFEEA